MMYDLSVYNDVALLGVRLVVALIFAQHGISKLRNPAGVAAGIGWPTFGVVALGVVESVSALMVALGLWTQVATLIMAVVLVGAHYYKIKVWHMPFSSSTSTGWEFDLILLAVAVSLLVIGAGGLSLDSMMSVVS